MTDNEMIAKYMGWDEYNTGVYYTPFDDASYCNGDLTSVVSFSHDLKFDKSWIWLIPVFEKLADELLEGHDDPPHWTDYCEIITFSKKVGIRIRGFFLHKEETLLLSAYAAVVEAVKFITEGKID